MRRSHQRLFAIGDEIARWRETLAQAHAELEIHRHLDDDARRDAAVGGPLERDGARGTAADVARAEMVVRHLEDRIARLEARRAELLARLGK